MDMDKITVREALMVLAISSGVVDETNIVETMRDMVAKVEAHPEGVKGADLDVPLAPRLVDWMVEQVFGQ